MPMGSPEGPILILDAHANFAKNLRGRGQGGFAHQVVAVVVVVAAVDVVAVVVVVVADAAVVVLVEAVVVGEDVGDEKTTERGARINRPYPARAS